MTEQHQAKPLAAEPKEKIDYLQPPLAYLVRIPVPDAEADSPLGEAARGRAEDAARWLSFQPVALIVCSPGQAAEQTAEILRHGIYMSEKIVDAQLGPSLLAYIRNPGPHVLVLRQQEIESLLLPSANVCSGRELVAPGGILSVHQTEGLRVIARTRVLDFSFTDFVETVSETQ